MAESHDIVDGPRGARPYEFGEVLDFLNYVFRSNVGRRPSMGGDYPHLYRESNAQNLRIIRVNGKIVSNVSIYPAKVRWGNAVLKVGGIGGVATHPDFRKQGYAGHVLEDCLDVMTREGYDLSILWTGIADYYRRWGWESAGQAWVFAIDRTTITYLPAAPSGEVVTGGNETRAIDAVVKLHHAARRGVVRDRELTEMMLNVRGRNGVAALYVNDKPTAYIVHSPGEQADVEDFGGDPESVLGLMRVVFGREGARRMRITTTPEDTGVAHLLSGRGFPARPEYSGMLAVVNPGSILKAHGVDDVGVEPTESGWEVTYGGTTVVYGKNDLVKLFFGPERPDGIVHPKLPLPFHYGPFDHM